MLVRVWDARADYNQDQPRSVSTHRVAAMVETWVHLWVGHHFRAIEFAIDFDTTGSDTQLSVAAVVQH